MIREYYILVQHKTPFVVQSAYWSSYDRIHYDNQVSHNRFYRYNSFTTLQTFTKSLDIRWLTIGHKPVKVSMLFTFMTHEQTYHSCNNRAKSSFVRLCIHFSPIPLLFDVLLLLHPKYDIGFGKCHHCDP